MPHFKHILFPIDFSNRCCGAVPLVESMARRFGAKVTLLAAAPIPSPVGMEAVAAVDPQQILQDVKAQLDTSLTKNFAGITVERVAELGDPANVIVDYARNHKVDLVMMPSHGYGPFRRLLLGSVTAKVLHDLDKPVWTSAHTDHAVDREHAEVRKILCAVDAGPYNVVLIRQAAELSKALNATLRIVHVVPATLAVPEAQLNVEFEEQIRQDARKSIEAIVEASGIDAPVCVPVNTIAEGVAEEATRHGADLVVIGRGVLTETLGRLRTHSYGIIRQSPCPVLSM